jgi:hypothetical protein
MWFGLYPSDVVYELAKPEVWVAFKSLLIAKTTPGLPVVCLRCTEVRPLNGNPKGRRTDAALNQ